MSAASGTLEAAMGALVDTAGFKSQLGLTGVTLSGDATKAKITSSATIICSYTLKSNTIFYCIINFSINTNTIHNISITDFILAKICNLLER
jgi:hypothetical protein